MEGLIIKTIINAIKGFFIGIALIAPGLSGSMFAVAVGLYDDILLAVDSTKLRRDFKGSFKFLLPIAIGAVIGILASAKAVLWLCETFPGFSYAFFAGLVAGSFPAIRKRMVKKPVKIKYFCITVAAFAFIAAISYLYQGGGEKEYVAIAALDSVPNALIIFGAGLFSCAMLAIPGVSGAIMLMLVGQYGTVYNALSSAGDFLRFFITGKFSEAFALMPVLLICVPFVIGGVIGFLVITKPIGYLIRNRESLLYYAVLGLAGGAFFVLIAKNVYPHATLSNAVFLLIFGAIGALCTMFLDKID